MSWHAVADANGYIVTFSQTKGDDQNGHCPNDYHTACLTVNAPTTTASIAVGGDVKFTVSDILRAHTTYEVTMVAISDARGTSRPSQTMRVLTPPTSET